MDEKYGALERYSEVMNTCHNMNSIDQTIDRDAYTPHGKTKRPNKKLENITRDLLMI